MSTTFPKTIPWSQPTVVSAYRGLYNLIPYYLLWDFPLQIVCDVVALVSVQPNGHSPAILGFCLRVPSFEDQSVNLIYLTLMVVHSVYPFPAGAVSIFWRVVAFSFNAAYIGNPKPTGFVLPPVFRVARSVAIESVVYFTRVLHRLHFLI